MKSYCLFVLCLFGCNISIAHKQTKNPELINPLLNDMPNSLSGYSDTANNINASYHRINWSIGFEYASKKLSGPVTACFTTIVDGANTLAFGLDRNYFNNANLVVKHHGITYTNPFLSTGFINIPTITTSVIEPSATLDFITVTTTAT